MEYKRFGNSYVLRVDKGEEILYCIKTLCEKEGIRLASISGIGAINEVQIGLFEPASKKYYSETLNGSFEIVSLSGNISKMNGEVYIHAHIAVTDREYKAYGGHLNKAVVSATAEIIITCIDGTLTRRFSDEIGLNLIDFQGE